MGRAAVFYGIAGCVTHLYVQKLMQLLSKRMKHH